ncbi:actin cortical patch SUR7/pH-response regulator pali [Tirmania nivea]|nr:actin cortical patch SUR7/pH-response regulator pali [Tirmania nivea]
MVRFTVIIPVLLSVAAFVMSLMVLLAGKNPNFLPNVYLFRLDTSNIKPSGLNLDYSSIISSLPISTDEIPESIIDQVPSSLIDDLAQTVAKQLGLKDYYYSHIMNYCSGVVVLTGDPDGSGPNPATGNDTRVTYCSPINGLYAFNPVDIFQTELISNYTINDLGIPSEVESGAKALAVAYKVMFICYTIGVALSGLCVLLGLTIGWMETRAVAAIVGLLSILSALALAVGASIATAISIQLKNVFNEHMGQKVNVWADNDGGTFIALSWAAVLAMVLAMIYWAFGCCCGGSAGRRRRERREQRKHEQMMREI